MFGFSLQLLSETFFILRRIERNTTIMYIGLDVKCPLFLLDIHETLTFSTFFEKIHKNQISQESARWEQSCYMRTEGRIDGQTEITKLIVAFRNFANAPQNDNCALLGYYAASSGNFILLPAESSVCRVGPVFKKQSAVKA
jgi:hypothetical protein